MTTGLLKAKTPRRKKIQPKVRRMAFVVSFDAPPGATIVRARGYVADAVASMKGSLLPPGYGPGGYDPEETGDPMFNLDGDTVHVTQLHTRKKGHNIR